MGSVVRLTFWLSEAFWEARSPLRRGAPGLELLSFLHTSDPDVPVWWTAFPVRAPLLVGWVGGPAATALAAERDEPLESRAVAALARQLGVARRRIERLVEGCWAHDWEHDPFARGAYSYPLVGGSDAAAELARPAGRTLFFAGEAADPEGRTGTVHGAIATGTRAAKQAARAIAASRPARRAPGRRR
jgi:monoamine oxidase